MKYSIILVCVLAVLFGSYVLAGESASDSHLQRQIVALREEVQELQALAGDVRSIESDVRELQTRVRQESNDVRPILSAEYRESTAFRDDPYLGPDDATTLVMAFSDFQCKPCRRFYSESFAELRQEFVETEKVKFVLRDYPLGSNANAQKAAHLAHCAGEQGMYWKMFSLLFEKQDAVDIGDFQLIVAKLNGLDQKSFDTCSESSRYDKEIENDMQEGKSLGARGAPGFFIGKKLEGDTWKGVFVRGAQPYPVLRAQISALL